MFTGIVEEVGQVITSKPDRLSVSAREVVKGLELGGSMAVNGVCLTVTEFDSASFSVGVIPETLRRTNLGLLKPGNEVNLERPLTLAKPLGGHLVQGHIDGTGEITSITENNGEVFISIETKPDITRYIVNKGFIAIDGISLTVVDCTGSRFRVSLVEYTRKHTNLVKKRVVDTVNLEVDIIAKYVEKFNQPRQSKITPEFLSEHGFMVG